MHLVGAFGKLPREDVAEVAGGHRKRMDPLVFTFVPDIGVETDRPWSIVALKAFGNEVDLRCEGKLPREDVAEVAGGHRERQLAVQVRELLQPQTR